MSVPRERDAALAGPVADAERSVLGSLILGREADALARVALAASDFHREAHRLIYAAILALRERGEHVDLVSLGEELRRRGDLETVGGPAALSSLLDVVSVLSDFEGHARIVREAAFKRRMHRLALDLQSRADDPAQDVASLLAYLAAQQAALASRDGFGAGRFADAARDAVSFSQLSIEKPRSLLGDGVLAAGALGILYGPPGRGKSWLAVLVARAWVRGQSWLGLVTPPEGMQVGLLQLELDSHALQARLLALGIGTDARDGGLHVVVRPNLRGTVDLFRQPGDLAALRRWIQRDRLDVAIVDALSRAHSANENSAEEFGQVLAALDAVRHETGCAILLIHHERKAQPGVESGSDLDALRGTSRLQSDPTLLMRLKQTTGGLRCIVFTKVSTGPTPEPIYFRLNEAGCPEPVESPLDAADANREKVLAVVLNAGRPVTRAEVEAAVGIRPSTAKKHLKLLVNEGLIRPGGDNRAAVYEGILKLEPATPAAPATHDPVAGADPLNGKGLDANGREPATATPQQPATPAIPAAPLGGGRRGRWPVAGRQGAAAGLPGSSPEPDPCPGCGGRVLVWGGVRICTACRRRPTPLAIEDFVAEVLPGKP